MVLNIAILIQENKQKNGLLNYLFFLIMKDQEAQMKMIQTLIFNLWCKHLNVVSPYIMALPIKIACVSWKKSQDLGEKFNLPF